ncbi:MAG: hypothetical protein KKC68_02165 [Candidatus Thermoplasmatota archaeon]|nr:hypothetical protein [Candidatus Thermoplasmatota archaeon]MBU1940555.1 hypothetical protein [Candidatus Thermoplasmatota archaeon]
MNKGLRIKIVGCMTIAIFFLSIIPISTAHNNNGTVNETPSISALDETPPSAVAICQLYDGILTMDSSEITITYQQAVELLTILKNLAETNAKNPLSEETKQLQQDLLYIAKDTQLLPQNYKLPKILPREFSKIHQLISVSPIQENKATEFFCNYVSTGSGSALPVIVFPRLIPILLTPIPRLYLGWSAYDGITSCGNLMGQTGFIATGAQKGILLGFWGIGFSIFLPPFMNYGLFGYAFFASVSAENIRFFPPNEPPILNAVFPLDGAQNIPISTNELQFYIRDPEGKLMRYSVSTSPNIGSGTGILKPKDTYAVSVSGLQPSTWYQWTVEVSDGKNTIEKMYSFTTAPAT